MRRFTPLSLALVLADWIVPGEASAYLDPATGSLILQAVVGGLAAGLFVAKRYWHQIKAKFSRGSVDPTTTPADSSPETEEEEREIG